MAEAKKAEGPGSLIAKFMAFHILGVPAPIVAGGALVVAIAGYLFYKNRSPGQSVAQPVAVPVGGNTSGGTPVSGGSASGVDYSAQLAGLTSELTGLQGSFTALGQTLSTLQAGQSAEQAALAALQAGQNQAANQPAAPAPLPPAITNPLYTNPIAPATNLGLSQQTPVYNPSPSGITPVAGGGYWDANGNFHSGSSAPVLPSVQQPYFQPNPYAYTGPTNPYTGLNTPVYLPLPQYTGPVNPIVSQPNYYTGPIGSVPSSVYGPTTSHPFSVGGHYVTYPNGQQIWVPG